MDMTLSMKDIHIPIHDDLDRRLSAIAKSGREAKASIVRKAVAEYVVRHERGATERRMREYAHRMSNGSDLITKEIGRHMNEVLKESTSW